MQHELSWVASFNVDCGGQESCVDGISFRIKASKKYQLNAALELSGFSNTNSRCTFLWKSVDACADGWKGDALDA
jgi:hypothetical protein